MILYGIFTIILILAITISYTLGHVDGVISGRIHEKERRINKHKE